MLASSTDSREVNIPATEQPHEANRTAEVENINNMAAPAQASVSDTLSEFDEHLRQFLTKGEMFNTLHTTIAKLDKRMANLERKRPATDDNSRNISAKRAKLLEPKVVASTSRENDSDEESDGDSDFSTAGEAERSGEGLNQDLDNILSEGEVEEIEENEDEFLQDLQNFYDESEETGPVIETDLAKIINKGLRSMGQPESVKKVKENHKRPANVNNLTVPRVAPIIWKNLSSKGRCMDAAVQKTMSKFMVGLTPIIKQIDLFVKNKKETKQVPLLNDLKQLAKDSLHMLSHAVSASNQIRKDAIKQELDQKFHSICEASHTVSEKLLFGDNLNTELKELDDTKKFHLSKRQPSKTDKKSYRNRYSDRGSDYQDFPRGWGKNHRPAEKKKPYKGYQYQQSYGKKQGKGKGFQNNQ